MQSFNELTTSPGHLVLDPFMGSGATAEAAQTLQGNFVGFEQSPHYHACAIERLRGSK